MPNQIQTFLIGTTGFAGSHVAEQITHNLQTPISDYTSAFTQLIIAIVTIFSLFKKKPKQ